MEETGQRLTPRVNKLNGLAWERDDLTWKFKEEKGEPRAQAMLDGKWE
jgi:hypothetical protein